MEGGSGPYYLNTPSETSASPGGSTISAEHRGSEETPTSVESRGTSEEEQPHQSDQDSSKNLPRGNDSLASDICPEPEIEDGGADLGEPASTELFERTGQLLGNNLEHVEARAAALAKKQEQSREFRRALTEDIRNFGKRVEDCHQRFSQEVERRGKLVLVADTNLQEELELEKRPSKIVRRGDEYTYRERRETASTGFRATPTELRPPSYAALRRTYPSPP